MPETTAKYPAPDRPWLVYIVRCADHTYYTGITNDITRRLKEHNGGAAGARYTRSRRPVTLVYMELQPDRSQAAAREYQLRRLPRVRKTALIANWQKQQGRSGEQL